MDVCIKNINEENWRIFKTESARHGLRLGDFFNNMIHEHSRKCRKGNAEKILHGEKILKGILTRKDLEEIRKDFRKNMNLRLE